MERAPDDLFGFMTRRSPGKRLAAAFFNWSRERLAPFVVLSVAAHITLFGLLAIAHGKMQRFRGDGRTEISAKAARRALEVLRLDPQESRTLIEALARLDDDTYEYIFNNAPELDPRLSEREQTEIFRSLMKESLGRLGKNRGGLSALDVPPWGLLPGVDFRGPVKTAEGDVLYPLGAVPDGRPTLYRLPAAAARRLESLRSVGEAEKGSLEKRGGKVEIRTEQGFAWVPDEYYHRPCPYERMIAFGGAVFYAVSGFPRLETSEGPWPSGASDRGRGRPDSVPEGRPADSIKVVYMPLSASRGESASGNELPELPALSEENIPKILDGLMAISDDDQVRVFTERFLNGRDPDDPLLARLTRRFLYENLGGAFNLGDRLSTAFDFLEELFYNKISQNGLIAYGLKNGKSRTGTEILLCLAALYDFERRGLAYLIDSLDEIEEVLAGRPGGRADVFNKPAKAFVLAEVYRDFVSGIKRRGLDDADAVLREYRNEQERIYRFLIDAGGEAGSRARYALGGLYWDEGKESRALKEWQAIDRTFETPALAQLRWIMSLTYGQDLIWSRISAVFREESTKNSRAALERFTKFHLWDKRSAKLRAGSAD